MKTNILQNAKVIFCQYISFFPQRVLTINEPVVGAGRNEFDGGKSNFEGQ